MLLNTCTYANRLTFFPFDKNQILAYLNEEVVENWKQPGAPEDAPAITGYSYTGPNDDGGTLLPCDDPNDYGCLVNAIIRSKYSLSDELAIQRHYTNSFEKYQEEWEVYNAFCETAKSIVRQWLGMQE